MTLAFRNRFLLGLMLVTALFSLYPNSVYAAGDTAYLTPASGSANIGDSFTVSVDGYVTHGVICFFICQNITSTQGTISFPKSLLEVTGISTANATFDGSITITPDNSNGSIAFSGGNPGIQNTSVHLFTVTFQTLAAGVANVAFGTVKYGALSSSNTAATTGGNYTINAPPPPPSPSPSPSPSPTPSSKPSTKTTTTTKPKTSPTPTPNPEVTPAPVSESDGGLQIENVKITATRDENSISWSLNSSAAQPTLVYGTTKTTQNDQATIDAQPDGSYKSTLANLKPGTLYYFTIKAATADNLAGASHSGILTTRGYPVQLTIQQNNLLIPGTSVKIGEREFIANKNAIVTTELSDGKFTAAITPPGSSDSVNADFTVQKLDASNGESPALQSFTLDITTIGAAASTTNSSLLPVIIGGALTTIGVIGGTIGLVVLRRRKQDAASVTNVDGDLLSASYGDNLSARYQNTPQPNLETGPTNQLQPQPFELYAKDVPMDANIPTEQIIDSNAGVAAVTPESVTTQQFAPEALPLPPAAPATAPDQYAAQYAAAAAVEPAPEQYDPVAEQMAQEVAQVESSEQATPSDEPSAVYDASTGELDIIHRHGEQESAETASSATPVSENDPTLLTVDNSTPQPQEQAPPANVTEQAPPVANPVVAPVATVPAAGTLISTEAYPTVGPSIPQTPLTAGPH